MKIETTYWEIKCKECSKKKKVFTDPYSETYICKKCISEMVEPTMTEFSDFHEFLSDLEQYEYLTNKTTKDVDLKALLFKEFSVKGVKAEKLYSYAWDKGRSDGLNSVAYIFEELVDLLTP